MVACVNKTSLSHSFEKKKTIATKFLPSLKSSVNTGGSLQKYHNVVHIDASSMRRRERIAKVEREGSRVATCVLGGQHLSGSFYLKPILVIVISIVVIK